MRRFLPLLVPLLAMAAPVAVGAQVTGVSADQHVDDRRFDYRTARNKHDAARSEWQELQHEWDQLLERHTAARRAGDDRLVQELLAQIQHRSGEMNRAETAWRTSREAWIAAGRALTSALDARLDILWGDIERSVGSASDANDLYDRLEMELEEVEREIESAREPLQLEPMPEIEIGQDDTPREIRYKATVIENAVVRYELLLDDLDREIESLVRRQERQQERRDFLVGRARFSDVVAPIGDQRSRSASESTAVPDSTARNLSLETLEARIEKRKALRKEIEDRMEETSRKAEEFRRRAGGRS